LIAQTLPAETAMNVPRFFDLVEARKFCAAVFADGLARTRP